MKEYKCHTHLATPTIVTSSCHVLHIKHNFSYPLAPYLANQTHPPDTPTHSLLSQLHDGVSVHEELIMVAPLRDRGSVAVDNVGDLLGRKLREHRRDVTGVTSQTGLQGLIDGGWDTTGDG